MSNRQNGFALVETLVAMSLVVLSALALAVTLAGGALINSRTADRQQAIAYAEQIIDRMRSLPYSEVGMAASTDPNDQPVGMKAFATGETGDAGRESQDWLRRYCPFQDKYGCTDFKGDLTKKPGDTTNNVKRCNGTAAATKDTNDSSSQLCPQNGRIITLPSLTDKPKKDTSGNLISPYFPYPSNKKDPRQAKATQDGLTPVAGQENSYQNDGLVAYTYVYWPYDRCATRGGTTGKLCKGFLRKNWKVVTVVVRYKDKASDSTTTDQKTASSVQLSTVILDNPGLNALPEIEEVPNEDLLFGD